MTVLSLVQLQSMSRAAGTYYTGTFMHYRQPVGAVSISALHDPLIFRRLLQSVRSPKMCNWISHIKMKHVFSLYALAIITSALHEPADIQAAAAVSHEPKDVL